MPSPARREIPPVSGTPDSATMPRAPWRKRIRWDVVFALASVTLLIAVAVGLFVSRTNQALSTIQQTDPRVRKTATAIAPPIATARPLAGGQLAPTQAVVPEAPPEAPPNPLQEPINILLIGVDKRPNPDDGVRSDTLILVHLDPQDKWASMLAIPRDSVVRIPHLGQAKINAAYAYGFMNAAAIYGEGTAQDAGGGALVAETVEQFLGVKVDYTAQVDFHGFETLVDSVGGVVVDVPTPLLDAEYPTEDYGVERIYIPEGLQSMNGHTALIYARSRHSSTDFDRGKRQQTVLRALLEQVRGRGLLTNLSTLPQWAELLEQNIRTTLPVKNLGMINGLASLARELKSDRITQFNINPTDVAIDAEDGSDIYWNRADVAALVARWQSAPPAAAAEAGRVQVLNGAQVGGIAGKVSDYLRGQGFALDDPGQAAQTYEHTLIIDYTGRTQTRQRLADTLGIDARYVQTQPGPDAPPTNGADIVVIVGQDYQVGWLGQ